MDLDGRTALITGASSGIGAATAEAMGARGARVVLLARTEAALKEVANRVLSQGGQAHVYACDLTDKDAVASTAASVRSEVGVPDVLVNNAGAGRWLFPHETPPDEVVSMMAAPYFAAFLITQQMLPGMLRRGSGWIVNITSPAGFVTWPGATGYVAARWAMRGFHEALKADLDRTGVGVSLVVPAEVASSYFANNPGVEARMPKVTRIYGKLSPAQVAEAIIMAVERERSQVIIPRLLHLTFLAHRLWPRPVEFLTRRTGARITTPEADTPADA